MNELALSRTKVFIDFLIVQESACVINSLINGIFGKKAISERDGVILYIFAEAAAYSLLIDCLPIKEIDGVVAQTLSREPKPIHGIFVGETHREVCVDLHARNDPSHRRIAIASVAALRSMVDGMHDNNALARLIADTSIDWDLTGYDGDELPSRRSVNLRCPTCGQHLDAEGEIGTHTVACPGCSTPFRFTIA